MARGWVADTEPNERFSLYTRGNVGEVFPNVITALTGTLIGPAVRASQVDLFVELGVLRSGEATGPSTGTGVFSGYLYMNGSVMRLFGVRMPGMAATTSDEQVFGAIDDLPPYVAAKGDRNLAASLRISRASLGMLRRPDLAPFDRARRGAQAWLRTMPDLAEGTDAQLLQWVATYPERLGSSMQGLLRAGLVASAPWTMLERILGRAGAEPGLVNRLVAGTGDVDSAQPAHRLWQLGRLVVADPVLTSAFDAGLDGIADRTRGSALEPELEAFLDDHGHRGNDEYELATPAWAMDPGPVYAAIDRLRHAPADRDPEVTTHRLRDDADAALAEAVQLVARPLQSIVRRMVAAARVGAIARERAKDILVLENLGARQVLHELARRAAERGGPTDARLAFCVTIDELRAFVASPPEFADVIAERAEQQRYLNDRVPPPWFTGRIPDPREWPLRVDAHPTVPVAGTTLHGIAVSGGTASGRARVIAEPGDPRGLEPGEVLVCAITDPSWTPLFLAAGAVVCDSGALQSHAAIVARELGIPAVLSVPGITAVPDGTLLHVDGTAGTVLVG